jgi:hypothetical protein
VERGTRVSTSSTPCASHSIDTSFLMHALSRLVQTFRGLVEASATPQTFQVNLMTTQECAERHTGAYGRG